jgi:hypothetical protein
MCHDENFFLLYNNKGYFMLKILTRLKFCNLKLFSITVNWSTWSLSIRPMNTSSWELAKAYSRVTFRYLKLKSIRYSEFYFESIGREVLSPSPKSSQGPVLKVIAPPLGSFLAY